MSILTSFRTALLVTAFIVLSHNAFAQSVIRDAEIEADLRTIAAPIFEAAGLNPSQVRIVLINDDSINAFVAGGQNLFIYSGLILEAKNVGELAGVIAHESGHMAGGHLIRLRDAMDHASTESILSAIAGIAIGVGAGDSQAGIATAMGGSEMAKRNFLRNSRTFESSADASGMATLERMGYSTQGMADFLERLAAQEVLPEMQRSPYILTHPLSRERLSTVENFIAHSRNKDKKFPEAWENKFRTIKAKLLAFTQPAQAQRDYASRSTSEALYATAIADYRQGDITGALQKIATLEKTDPSNPYLAELRGQILFEQGRTNEAATAYRKAVSLAPNNGLLNLMLAQTLLQKEDAATAREAITYLQKARENGEGDTSNLYRFLAIAYGRSGNDAMAKLSLAEEALLKRDLGFAVDQANRAKTLIGTKDPAARQRANDIIARARTLQKQK